MLITTTPVIEGRTISEYLGVIVGEAVIGRQFVQGSLCRDMGYRWWTIGIL